MTMTLQRSILAVPATSAHFFMKAAHSAADSIFLDLEDSVAVQQKEQARAAAIEALNSIDWYHKRVAVRINQLDSQWGYRDIVDVVEACPRLDSILVPKAADAEDIRFVARLIDGIEARRPRLRRLGIDALIETPQGLANVETIAAASPRLESLSFGVGDYSVYMHAPQTNFGVPDADYGVLANAAAGERRAYHWNDQWHYALARIANACRANGVRPIDGPFTDIQDRDGYLASARRARALGLEGKWAIHPSQVELANRVFSPQPSELEWAEQVSTAMKEAIRNGRGAAQLDGRMVDLAHVRHAEDVLARHQQIMRAGAVGKPPGSLSMIQPAGQAAQPV